MEIGRDRGWKGSVDSRETKTCEVLLELYMVCCGWVFDWCVVTGVVN